MSETWDRNNPRVPFEETGQWVTDPNTKRRDWVKDPVQMHLKMLEYSYYHSEFAPLPNFSARLELIETTRGRTAATSWWRDIKTGVTYPMSFNSLSELLKKGNILCG